MERRFLLFLLWRILACYAANAFDVKVGTLPSDRDFTNHPSLNIFYAEVGIASEYPTTETPLSDDGIATKPLAYAYPGAPRVWVTEAEGVNNYADVICANPLDVSISRVCFPIFR